MPGHCRRLRPPVRAAAVAVLVAACAAVAQQPRPGELPQAKTLYLVLRTGPEETEKGILTTLKLGLERSGARSTGEPTIRAVSPAFFEEFESLVERGGPAVAAADDGVAIRPLPTRETMFEVKLQPTQVLRKLRVTYQKAGAREYVPSAAGEKGQLVLIVPGRYAFTPEAGDQPTNYEGEVAELGKGPAAVKGEWPKTDKFFVVTVRGFDGDQKELFRVIQDPKQVANPLENVRLGGNLEFAFASLNSGVGIPGDGGLDQENNLNLTVETVARRNPRRVWVYFPLDQKGLAAARERFGKLDSVELPKEIRKEAVRALDPAEVTAKADPKWLELPPEPTPPGADPRRFGRKVKVDGAPEFVARYPQLGMLVVWEFEAGGGQPEAIQVRGPRDERVFALEREIPGWSQTVQKLSRPAPPK